MPRTPTHPGPFELGPFTIERFIGRGGMASVWGGRHRASGIPVALKVVDAELARAQRYRVAFAHEVRAVARLDHPGVVRVFDHGAVDDAAAAEGGLPRGAPFLIMERLDGGPLDRLPLTGGPEGPSWITIARVLEVLLDALAHAHARGVIHRDLKPDNVLFGARGPVITDFGLAFRPGRDRADTTASGTPGYMAPEQIRGAWRRFGPPTDLYALGCIAWELACGAAPHLRPGLPPLAVAMAHLNQPLPAFTPRMPLPPRFEGWLRRLLARAPEDRFPLAADALGALRAIIDDRPDGPPTMPPDWRAGEQPPRPALLVGVGRALFGHRSWPAVGRERDRDRLWRALRRVRSEGRPRASLIEGPSGHGKTHLAEWLAERAHGAGIARVLRARHEPSGPDGGPAGGFGPMLARHFGVVGDDAREALPAITALPALRDGPRRRAVEIAALAAPDGVCIDGEIEVRLDRAARAELLPDALAALASDRPLVVLVDDAQWGLSSLRIIERLLGMAEGPPVLLVLTVRSDAVARGSPAESRLDRLRRHPAVDRSTLGPLDADAHRRVIRAMLPVHEELATALVERAAGSPLFAAELLRYFIGAGLLEDGPGGYRLAPGAADGLPRGLQAVWQARLVDALGVHAADAWPALELAAALGLAVDGDEWTAACARAATPWSRVGMERLLDARLMRITEAGEWAFCHAMLRETLAASSRAAGRWAAVNRACAAVLTERRAPSLRRAEHHLAAGDRLAAIEPLNVAAGEALLDGEVELLQRLVRQRLGILRALRVPREDRRWQALRLHYARMDQRAGRYPRSLRRARQVERIAAAQGDARARARAMYVIGNALYYTDGPRKSVGVVAAGLPLAREVGDPGLLTRMLSDYASTLMFLGRMDESEAALLEAWGLLGAEKSPRQQGTVLYYLANVHAFRGETEAAIARCRQAREAFSMTGSRHPQALTWSVEGDLERRQGALDRAARCYAAFAERVNAAGPAERAYLALNAALLALARGQLRSARAHLDRAAAESLSTQQAVIAAAYLACAGGLGDWLMWDATAHRLVAILDDAPISPDVPWAAERAADAADAAGQPIRAALARRIAVEHRQRLTGGEGSSSAG